MASFHLGLGREERDINCSDWYNRVGKGRRYKETGNCLQFLAQHGRKLFFKWGGGEPWDKRTPLSCLERCWGGGSAVGDK